MIPVTIAHGGGGHEHVTRGYEGTAIPDALPRVDALDMHDLGIPAQGGCEGQIGGHGRITVERNALADHVEVRFGRQQTHGAVGHMRRNVRVKVRTELAKALELRTGERVHSAVRQRIVRIGKVGIDARGAHMASRRQRSGQGVRFLLGAQSDAGSCRYPA